MSFHVIVPARLSASRLPEKPLADIAGLPMVVRTALQALKSGAQSVTIACDDARIAQAAQGHGVPYVMTPVDCANGTERLAFAVQALGLDDTVVVNVQGDEPLIDPEVVRAVAAALLANPECAIATAAHPIDSAEDFFDANVVKVVCTQNGRALYFTRAPVPWARDAFARSRDVLPQNISPLRHVGLYAYRSEFLTCYRSLKPTPLELAESLEQLRALEHGFGIAVMVIPHALPAGVDTPADLERVRRLLGHLPG